MTEFIFMWLEKIGYTHPIHIPATHVPMGMVMGAFAFVVLAVFWNKRMLLPTAKHCYLVALITIPPTAFAGYMDWQHAYGGAYSPFIVLKVIAATALFALCVLNVRQLAKADPNPRRLMVTVAASLIAALLLGYAGGEVQAGR